MSVCGDTGNRLGNSFIGIGTAAYICLISSQFAGLKSGRHRKRLHRGSRFKRIADAEVSPQRIKCLQTLLLSHGLLLLCRIIFRQIPWLIQIKIRVTCLSQNSSSVWIHHDHGCVFRTLALTVVIPQPFIQFQNMLLHDRLQIRVNRCDNGIAVRRAFHYVL